MWKSWFPFWLGMGLLSVRAMDLGTDYDPATHDVYASGYPTAPVRNGDPAFTGAERSLAAVGWSAATATKSFGFLTPEHYLLARHFGGAATVEVFGADGLVRARDQKGTENLNLGVVFQGNTTGDLALGTLEAPFPLSAMPRRVGILDLHVSSDQNSETPYEGVTIHVYGRGPDAVSSTRLAEIPVSTVDISGNNHVLTYSRDPVKLQSGDSGSPTYVPWSNPNGDPEYALVGNHAAINEEAGINFDNFAAGREVMEALRIRLADEGRSLRLVGNPELDWEGNTSTNVSSKQAWGVTGPAVPEDVYARFDGATAGNGRAVTIDALFNLRGISFVDTGGSSLGFAFTGGSVLEIGRGGITNYDGSVQDIDASVRLTDGQYWISGGGLEVGALDTNGYLLEIGGTGGATFDGTVTGSGGLAFAEGVSVVSGAAGYTGDTWVHEAELRVMADLSASPVVRVAEAGVVSGTGRVAEIRVAGAVSPGPSDGILTAARLTDAGGVELRFGFQGAAPSGFSDAGAPGNDILRLTDATPFSAALPAEATLSFYVNTGSAPAEGDVFLGGVFTDVADDFLPWVREAEVRVYLAGAGGSVVFEGGTYSPYAGEGEWELSTVSQTADFGAGSVNGRLMRLRLLPPPGTYENWTYTAFPEGTPEGDKAIDTAPNTEGIENRYAYAYGLNPLNPDPALLPYDVRIEGGLALFYRMRTEVTDLDYVFETTADLTGTWTEESVTPVVEDADPDGTGEVRLMKIERPLGPEEGLLFLRLRHPSLP